MKRGTRRNEEKGKWRNEERGEGRMRKRWKEEGMRVRKREV